MKKIWCSARLLVLGLVASATLFVATASSLADVIRLKSGKAIECEIVREESDFWVIKLPDGTTDYISKVDVKSVERTAETKPAEKPADTKPAETKPAETKPAETKPAETKATGSTAPAIPPATPAAKKTDAKTPRAVSGVTRVAVLPFGGPSAWQGRYGDTVGVQVNAKSWHDAIPALEKDKTDVVVVRINSGGGALAELEKFHKVFQEEYKKRWRVVTWVESAISAACMSPWVIEEWYFLPEGNAGSNTGWSGNYQFMGGTLLLEVLYMMEKASDLGRHPKEMMRSMQIPDPLSCNIDANNNVTWFQDSTGKYIVNPEGQILCLNARDAVKYGFAKGIAATEEELAQVMGLNEVEWVGKEAFKIIEASMKKNDEGEKTFDVNYRKYTVALAGALALQGEQNKDRRLIEVGVAKRHLNKLEELAKGSPALARNLPPGWFKEQRELLKQLAQ